MPANPLILNTKKIMPQQHHHEMQFMSLQKFLLAYKKIYVAKTVVMT